MTDTFALEKDLLLTEPTFWTKPGRHERFRHMRQEAPVSFHPEFVSEWWPNGGAGFWAVMRHDDVQAVTRNPKRYSSAFGTNPMDEEPELIRALGILHMDDPEHRVYRSIVGPAFSPRFTDSLMDAMARNADRCIDALLAKPNADVVAEVVNVYPIMMIVAMLALPEKDQAQFVEWTRLAFGPDKAASNKAHRELIGYGIALTAGRRANPGDDVISRIVTAEVDGRKLSDLEVGGFISLLIGAGAETTGSTIAHGIWKLSQNPDQFAAWKANPELGNSAINEILRSGSAVINFRRTATEDHELRGKTIKKGDKVVMYYESANNDETVFSDPEKFDITRDARLQVSFGAGGPHQCLGEHLGRREIRVFFNRFLERVDRFEITTPFSLVPSPRFNMAASLRGNFHGK